jgi:hypothetical protein
MNHEQCLSAVASVKAETMFNQQPNYAKQTQFPQQQNEHNLLINKGL